MKILLYVQHLLGIGHVRRAALLAEAMVEAGLEVTVASGGFPVAGVEFGRTRLVQLPAARAADAGFQTVLDEAGQPIGARWEARRAGALLDLHAALQPDAVVLESFPFGRRRFRFELLPLMQAARARAPRPLIASSVRDILVATDNPAKEAWMAETARRWFDLILVHGDPALIPFDATFPPAAGLADLIRYTGYVVPPRAAAGGSPDGEDEVIVSTGGGAVGADLLRAALAARPLCGLATAPWRFLLGPDLPAAVAAELYAAAGPGIVVEPARLDFPALLARCRLSISQAGYNTTMDVLAAGCRAVLSPFEAAGETEQAVRAGLLAARGLLQSVPAASLEPRTLAAAVDAAVSAPRPTATEWRRDGATTTARLLIEALSARSTRKNRAGDTRI